LKKEAAAAPNIFGKLQFEAVRGIRHLKFLLLEHRFFKDSEEGSALSASLPWPLSTLSLMFHIAETHALVLLRLPCYFVKLEAEIVGLFAIQEYHESLRVASLGVAKEYRRLGIGTFILDYIETIAKHLDKRWVEVDVFGKNAPAQRLYASYGFKFFQTNRMLYRMRKEIRIDH